PDDVGLSRADSPPDAYLLGPLRHTDQHDVHHPDAADEQTGRRQRENDEAGDRRKLRQHFEDAPRRADPEIIRLGVWHFTPAAHQFSDLVHHASKLLRFGSGVDADVFYFRVIALQRVEGHDQFTILDRVAAEQSARSLLHYADYPVDFSIHFDLFIQRVKGAE